MRALLTTALLLVTAACAGGGGRPDFRGPPSGGDGPPRGRLFVSPMGEPFRGDAPQARWFTGADTNHDGALDSAEFTADAARWFAVLDRGHDGEIAPDDVDYYEGVLFPEIRSGGGMGGGMRGRGPAGGGEMGRMRGGSGGRRSAGRGPGGEFAGGSAREGKQGAARFGYLDYPEPVTAADTNFNRGVDAREFARAADERFALLDKNNDGKIEQAELPHLNAVPAGPGGRRRVPGE